MIEWQVATVDVPVLAQELNTASRYRWIIHTLQFQNKLNDHDEDYVLVVWYRLVRKEPEEK